MNEIKVGVSITLPGGVMLTQAEAEQLEKEKAGTGYNMTRLVVTDEKGNKDVLHIRTRKCRTCSQSINICEEAYDYMTSNDGCPPNIKSFRWFKMSKKQRLEAHLNLICETLRGISYTYKVFDE